MASFREESFEKYWEGKGGRKLTTQVVKDAYMAGWSDRPYTECKRCGHPEGHHHYLSRALGACEEYVQQTL